MKHAQLGKRDGYALSQQTVRNLFVDADWNRLPWLADDFDQMPSRARQQIALPWFIACLVIIASLSYVQGRTAAERRPGADDCTTTAVGPVSCIRVWESVSVTRSASGKTSVHERDGRLPPVTAMTSADRQLLGRWMVLAQALSPGDSEDPPRPVAPD